MIEYIPLSESGENHFAKELFESAFPENERPSFSRIKDREEENFHFLVASIDDEPIGILSYWEFEEFSYIEHFAIAKDVRNRGLGKAAILDFMMQHPNQVVLEAETPVSEQAERRLEFYTDLGFTQCSQEYWQPSYREQKLQVPMLLMTRYELDDEEFEEVREILYKTVYHYEGQK